MGSDATRVTKVQQFPDETIVASGGKVTVESGGAIEMAAGASLKYDGTELKDALAEVATLNGLNASAEDLDALAGISSLGTPVDGVKATLTVDSAPANSDLVFTAVAYGAGGNSITIEVVQPVSVDSPFDITVEGNAIRINLPTDNAGAPVAKTANQVKALWDATPAAVALATVAVEGTGAGNVDDAAAAPLTGGVTCTAGNVPSFKVAANGATAYVKVSAQVWKKFSLAAL